MRGQWRSVGLVDLVVRGCEPEDYKAVHLIYSSPRAMAETLGVPFSSERAWREELAGQRDDNFSLVACVRGEVVGHLALSVYMNPRTRHSGHFGIAVRDDWQGKGIGTALMEACLDLTDNWLNLARLDLRVYVDNAPAIALYEKFGFEIEGTHRRFAWRNGEYVDARVMARLR
jgi:L-phenylalanine/L-methionine N-acetyltransferase